jgi:uncharacterized membrane protein YfcA
MRFVAHLAAFLPLPRIDGTSYARLLRDQPMLIVLTVLILFVATLAHTIFGFGSALVAMPLLVLTVGVQTATPLVAFVMLTTTGVLLWGSWRHVDLRATRQLVLSSVVGIPVGVLVLKTAPEAWVKRPLGVFIIMSSLYTLLRPPLRSLEQRGWAYVFGFVAGVLGGAYNTNGPPLVLYGALRRWPPEQFRATLQGYFVLATVMIWVGHGLSGLWTLWVVTLYLLSLPLVLLALVLGARLNRRLSAKRFDRLLCVILLGLGLLLLF